MLLYRTAEGHVLVVVGDDRVNEVIPIIEPEFHHVLLPGRDSDIPDAAVNERVVELVTSLNRGGDILAVGQDGEEAYDVCRRYGLSPRLITNVLLVTHIIPGPEVWNQDATFRRVLHNLPTSLALLDLHLLNPKDEGITKYFDLSEDAKSFINYVESYYEVQVVLIGTGKHVMNRGMDL